MPTKASETILRPATTFLFKGNNGTGKSIAAWGKEFRPVYTFDLDGRMDAPINYYKRLEGKAPDDCEYDTFTIRSGYYNLDKRLDELIARPEYRTIHVASLTSFIYLILNHLIVAKAGMTRANNRPAGRKIGGIPINELEDYNAEDSAIINDLIAFFQEMKNAGCNCILEAHVSPYELVTLEEGQRVVTTIRNILTKGKKAPAAVPGFFNEIYYFNKVFEGVQVGNKSCKYTFTSEGSELDDCKTSWGIKGFDFTGKDFSVELFNQLTTEFRDTPRADPDRPRVIKMG